MTDHWALSGIAQFQSGSPYNPGCAFTSGTQATTTITGGFAGTPDLTQRCQVLGNHTEISSIGSSGQYSPTTNQVTNAAKLGYITGATNARVLAFSIRLQF